MGRTASKVFTRGGGQQYTPAVQLQTAFGAGTQPQQQPGASAVLGIDQSTYSQTVKFADFTSGFAHYTFTIGFPRLTANSNTQPTATAFAKAQRSATPITVQQVSSVNTQNLSIHVTLNAQMPVSILVGGVPTTIYIVVSHLYGTPQANSGGKLVVATGNFFGPGQYTGFSVACDLRLWAQTALGATATFPLPIVAQATLSLQNP